MKQTDDNGQHREPGGHTSHHHTVKKKSHPHPDSNDSQLTTSRGHHRKSPHKHNTNRGAASSSSKEHPPSQRGPQEVPKAALPPPSPPVVVVDRKNHLPLAPSGIALAQRLPDSSLLSQDSYGGHDLDISDSEGSISVAFFKLKHMDSLYICPTKNVPEEILGSRCSQTYEILDYSGERHFYAAEQKQGCLGWFFGSSRSFEIRVYDETGDYIFSFRRPMTCIVCLCGVDCFLNCTQATIASYKSVYIGKTRAALSCCGYSYVVEDVAFTPQYTLKLPRCSHWLFCKRCKLIEIPICNSDSEVQIGKIQLGYDGLIEDRIPNPKTISVIFPPHCSPDLKACLLGTGFMTDVTYFQRRGITCHRLLIHLFMFSVIFGSLSYGLFTIIKKPIK